MTEFWSTSGLDLLVHTSRSARRASLEASLREAIQSRRLAPGSRLPSSRELAADLGWSRGTVSAAYEQLTSEGYLVSRLGAGTTVADLFPLSQGAEQPAAKRARPRFDLRPGTPAEGSFPVSEWLRATRVALQATHARALGYNLPRGRSELRGSVADYLGRTRGLSVTPDQVVITSGTTNGLALLGSVLAARGVAVATEDPGFSFHRDVMRHAGVMILPAPVDAQGAQCSDLARTGAGAVLVTPAHQYPTGVTMSASRRLELVAWAQEHDGLIIEDDYDGEFRYDRKPVGALQGTAPDRVAYLGTTSKAVAPALRLGWLVLPPRLVEPVAEVERVTTLGVDVISQLTVHELLSSHAYDRHVRLMRTQYRRRHKLLADAVQKVGPDGGRLALAGTSAGGQAPLYLPTTGPSSGEIVAIAAKADLALESIQSSSYEPGTHPDGLLIGFSRPPERAYPAAVDQLIKVLGQAFGSR